MNRTLILLTLATALVASGCFGRARVSVRSTARVQARTATPHRVVVHQAPPTVDATATAHGAAPSPDSVWVDGYYKWENDDWVWVDGHWESGHQGEVWVAPVANQDGDDVVYYPGYWCPEDQTPPEEYRSGGTVRVTVRAGGSTSGGATPPSRGTVRASGDNGTGTTGGTATVRVRPRNVNRADGTVAVAEPREQPAPPTYGDGGSGEVVPSTRPGVTVRNPETDGPVLRPTGPGEPSTGPHPGVVAPVTDGPVVRPNPRSAPLACTLQTARAPRGGLVSLSGSFTSSTRVMIGGQLAQVAARNEGSLQVRVPGSSGGGAVTVTDSGATVRCGQLAIGGR